MSSSSFAYTAADLSSFSAAPNDNRPANYPNEWSKFKCSTAQCEGCNTKLGGGAVKCAKGCGTQFCDDCFDNGKTFAGLMQNIAGCSCQYPSKLIPNASAAARDWRKLQKEILTTRGANIKPEPVPSSTPAKSAKKRKPKAPSAATTQAAATGDSETATIRGRRERISAGDHFAMTVNEATAFEEDFAERTGAAPSTEDWIDWAKGQSE